jgi:predicted permease
MTFRQISRTLFRDRGFAVVAILTLALGIGGTTAIFSLIYGILLKPIPYRDPEGLVAISEIIPKFSKTFGPLPVNGRHLLAWRKQIHSFEGVAGLDSRRMTLTGAGEPEQVGMALISYDLFRLLGVQPSLGRDFLAEEDQPGKNRVVILSDGLWRSRFSSDPRVIGSKILLDGTPHTVVGVMPRTYHFFANHQLHSLASLEARTDIFRPLGVNAEDIGWMGDFNFAAIARLKPGVSRERALDELNAAQAGIETHLKGDEVGELRASLTPLQEQITGQSRQGLFLLLGAVGGVLLIVCVNLANLMLARAVAKRREAAVRAALGASVWELMRNVLAESLLLSAAGGALGLLAAWWGVELLVKTAPAGLPRIEDVTVDGTVLGFSLAITLMTGLLFGILPAWKLGRSAPGDALRSGGRSATESAGGMQMRSLLVVAEVALSAVLLIASGLLLHSFVKLMKIDRGFDSPSVIAADLELPVNQKKEARIQLYAQLLTRVRAIPGVRSAGIVSVLPLEGEGWADIITIEGDNRPMLERPIANYRVVTPGYFETMGIALHAGRFLADSDRQSLPVLISDNTARRVFAGKNPIGQHFWRGRTNEKPFEVIGVVGDVRVASLQQPPGMLVYVPYWYQANNTFSVAARTSMDPAAAAPMLRAAVREVDANVPVARMRTMDQIVSESVSGRRFQMALVLLFSVTALVLASLGIYGVVSYMVTQRRGEMGIRIALGAGSADVHRLILGRGLGPVAAGLVLGAFAALLLGQVMGSLLFDVHVADPATYVGVCGVLLAAAALACLVPSLRAVREDPASTLRYE